MNVALNLVPSAVGQTRPQIISAIVANDTATTPLPTSFADPMYVVSPTDSGSWWKVTDWPASRGITLPQAGAAVALFYDVKGVLRCVWWDGVYRADPITAPPRGIVNTSPPSGAVSPSTFSQMFASASSGSFLVQNGMEESGGGFKVPIAGYYQIFGQVTSQNQTFAGYIQVTFEINGGSQVPLGLATADVPNTPSGEGSPFPTATGFWEQHLNANDVVTLLLYNGTLDAVTPNAAMLHVRYSGQ